MEENVFSGDLVSQTFIMLLTELVDTVDDTRTEIVIELVLWIAEQFSVTTAEASLYYEMYNGEATEKEFNTTLTYVVNNDLLQHRAEDDTYRLNPYMVVRRGCNIDKLIDEWENLDG